MRRPVSRTCLALLTASVCLLQSTLALAAVGVGEPAPALSLPQKGGGTLSLGDLRGRVIYLDFWASWCGPCRQSFPWMNEMLAKYQPQGLQIVAVNVDTRTADAETFLAQVPASFAVVFDDKGKSPATYGLKGMPTSYLIGPDGKVLLVHQSFKDSDRAELESRIVEALQKIKP